MFKFGFFPGDNESSTVEKQDDQTQILKGSKQIDPDLENETQQKIIAEVDKKQVELNELVINYLNSNQVVDILREVECSEDISALKAEETGSDLIPKEYEGGMKIWECTFDMLKFLASLKTDFENKKVLDLGCGAGILGIYAMKHGAEVIFQDYNEDVIRYLTIPNVKLNRNKSNKRCEFYSGEWGTFTKLINDMNGKFDYIFTSETIYNTDYFSTLHLVLSTFLKKTGTIYLAAKMCYFGVGGSIALFEDFMDQKKTFKYSRCWECNTGVKRAILKIDFR